MLKTLPLLLALASFHAVAGSGSYHVCTDAKGQKLFTQDPCPNGQAAEVKRYSVSNTTPAPASASDNRLSTDNPAYIKMRDSNRRAELERAIKKNEKEISKLQQQLDTELAGLKIKQGQANNNLAGATYQQSLATEMQAVTDRYKLQMQNKQSELDRQREELAGLAN
jgi:hypothetical protein